MNKLTKGSIAAGAGLVLLLGGAGTFMSWQDIAENDGGTVTAGSLDVTAEAPIWKVNGEQVEEFDEYQMAPGDKLVYSTALTVNVVGDTLSVSADLGGGSITPTGENTDASNALAEELGDNAALALVDADGVTLADENGDYSFGEGEHHITATATLNYEYDSSDDGGAMEGEVDLDGMNITLTQQNPNLGADGTE